MRRSVARSYWETLLVLLVYLLFARCYLVENFKIPSASMADSLLIGDHLLVNKLVFGGAHSPVLRRLLPMREPRRGDVVVFKYPWEPRRDFIKRCVAVAGDTVMIRHKVLTINGVNVDEPYALHRRPDLRLRRDFFGPETVPAGTIFCLGDNRDESHDSRFWGPVPRDHIKGRALLIYWSFEARPDDWRWQGIGHRLEQLGGVFVHFFTKTRWERQLRLIR